MARGFRRKGTRSQPEYVARLDPTERSIVAGLMEQTRALLAPEVVPTGDPFTDLLATLDTGSAAPEAGRDPALARLLPDAHRGDPEVAAEFRRLTEQGLRQHKYAILTTAIDVLRAPAPDGRLLLNAAQAESVLVALTDTRLLIGERLGLRTEEDADRLADVLAKTEPGDPRGYAVAVYDFLTWLQDSLAGALLGRGLFR